MIDRSEDLKRPMVIAEVALSHDGSLGMAYAFLEAAAKAGADAVKFQTHIATAESTLDEPFRVAFSQQDATRYDYWRRTAFTAEQWRDLAARAKDRGIIFLSSPFSVEAVHLLASLGVTWWKVPSGELRSRDLLEAMLAAGGHIVVSSGMSPWQEIDDVVAFLRSRGAAFTLMQCTTRYPTPLREVGLNVLDELRRRYSCPVGLSDHSGTPFPALAAMARGAAVVELHVTFDRRMFGPDVPASITFEELNFICQARDAFGEMDESPVDKDAMANSMASMRQIFGRSLAPSRPLAAGTQLAPGMLVLRKPGGGIPMEAMQKLMGRRLARDVEPERILRWDDVEKVAE
jgi:N,N'-diacetyllegionaminate synthase